MTRRQIRLVDTGYVFFACVAGNVAIACPVSTLWRTIIFQFLIGSVSIVSYYTGMKAADKIARGEP